MADRILIVDPSSEAQELKGAIENQGFTVDCLEDGESALRLAEDSNVTAVITEHALNNMSGLSLIEKLHKRFPILPVVMFSRAADSNLTIQSIQAGAYDFIPKSTDFSEILEILEEALESARRMGRKVTISAARDKDSDALVGQSRAMTKVYRDLARLAATPVTVLIRGETGTGKELIARALYQYGHRAHKPFYAVNCAAIPPDLLESELFGHEKGAFTGAVNTRIGRFETANGATLFLDEIGDMDHALQAKLLRVLQERQIQRVGSQVDIPVDVRFIAATHQNLEKMVSDGRFREDLFYRLNAASIELPPLRDRTGDIPLLIDHFLSQFGQELGIEQPSITQEAIRFLESETWPGNIRQLQNVLRRALIKRREYVISVADLQELFEQTENERLPTEASLSAIAEQLTQSAKSGEIDDAYRQMIEVAEKAIITSALKHSANNQALASRWLGITRYTLREKLKAITKG